jgi:hypothetical protein
VANNFDSFGRKLDIWQMRTLLFIGACILALILLQLIPYQVNMGAYTIISSTGALPHPFIFFHICLLSLAFIVLITSYSFRKPLPEGLILKKKDKQLAPYFRSIAAWAIFILPVFDIDYLRHTFTNIRIHIVLILVSVLAYGFLYKWFCKKYQPAQLCMYNDTIAIRSLLRIKKLPLHHLKRLSYNSDQNSITFHFDEGLNNIKLYLSEYDPAAIKEMIAAIRQQKGDTIEYEANFVKHFS